MTKSIRILVGITMIVLLVAVRAWAPELFYDPLISYFKSGHLTKPLPEIAMGTWLFHMSIRFLMNTLLSLVILWVLFQKREVLVLSGFLYGVFFILALAVLLIFLNQDPPTTGIIFYVRRFLIHPVLLLLLIPAFYFQQRHR